MHLNFWLLLPLLIIVNAEEIVRGGFHDDNDGQSEHRQCKGILHGNKKYILFSKCAVQQCQDTCLNPTNSLGCTGKCKPGCVCAEGYLRNSVGECVLPLNCDVFPTCAGMNEVFSYCGNNNCQSTCLNVVGPNCVPRCGTPACICATGFIRDPASGNCILPEMCPCPANEIFNLCGCEGTCENPDIIACMVSCPGARCVCQEGFVRNLAGICIRRANCPQICPPGKFFSECGQDSCQETCMNPVITNCMPMCTTPGCICEDGLVLDTNNNCIPPEMCPCPNNEILNLCGCERTCTNQDLTACLLACPGPRCVCRDGFVRENGVCIMVANCPQTCPPGKFFSECGQDSCQETCMNPVITNCIPMCTTPGCICEDGLVLDTNNNCIPPEMCPCPDNEILDLCGCEGTCDNPDITACMPCPGPRCVCQNGFVRMNGICIMITDCPPPMCTGVNEVFSQCDNNDCQITCLDMDNTGCIGDCIPGCICMPGFIRNFRGDCVPVGDCEMCPDRERYRMCGRGECESTCQFPDLGNDPNCDNSNMCQFGCFCVPGFIRDSTGICKNRPQAIC